MKSQLLITLLLLVSLALLAGLSLSDESPVRPDRSGPAPTLTPVWHESDGSRIETPRGRHVWIHNLGAPVSANATDEGIHLQVLNQSGEPAVSARVEAYPPELDRKRWYGSTDEEGRAEVGVPDGTWTLVVSSSNDHFVIVREGVSAPGSLTLDTTGTVSVEVTAHRLDGQSLSGATISFEPFAMGVNMVGDMDLEGHLHVDLTPGTYCGLATSWVERYYLNRREVVVTAPTSVAFDATQMGTGQVVMRLSGFAEMELDMWPQPSCRGWSPILTMADGETTVLSADRYELNLGRFISGTNDTTWYFSYDANDTPYDILPGSVTTVWAGGTHFASIASQQPIYPPGASVYLDQQVVDAYGNRLSWVAWDWEPVYAHIVIRGPQGSIVYDEDDCWWPSWAVCTFVLAHDAAQGSYEVDWSVDTGPLQGVLHATTHFSVEGTPVTPTPTETATVTPTSTWTPTPTVNPTPTWKLYLPLIRKEALISLALLPGLSLTGSDSNNLSSESPVRTDRLGPPPTLTPVWHESDGSRIEIYRGERVWIHNLDTFVSANATDEGIHLQVLNQSGEPAVSARVEAYPPELEWRQWYGYTDEDGRTEVGVPDGTWILTVSSWRDHFVIVREGVTAPGSLTLDTTGTVSVEVTARRLDGQPLSGATISFEPFAMGVNEVGDTDSKGHLNVDLMTGTYYGLATSWDERYYLNQRGVMVTGPTSVSFDATQMGTGQVLMRLSDLTEMGLSMMPEPWCRWWSPIFSMADGETAVLSADRYELGLHREISEDASTDWLFDYDAKDTPHDIAAGSVTTVWAGVTHTASIAPGQATYSPGTKVYLYPLVVDDFGNSLRQVAWGPEQTLIPPHVIVRGPQGGIVYEDDCRWSRPWMCDFYLAGDATQGNYDVECTLDTGPLQGVLHATTHFSVEGSPLTPTPTKTATATPTSTCTPTPTVTPTPAWKLYLPLIRKEMP